MIDIERLRERLRAAGLTPNAASQRAGLGRDYVRDILRGRIRDPGTKRLELLAKSLNCAPSYLLGNDQDSNFSVRNERLIAPTAIDSADALLSLEEEYLIDDDHDRDPVSVMNLINEIGDTRYLESIVSMIGDTLYLSIKNKLSLRVLEANIVIGTREDQDYRTGARRLILAKGLNIINEDLYRRGLSLIRLNERVKDQNDRALFEDSLHRRALAVGLGGMGVSGDDSPDTFRRAVSITLREFVDAEIAMPEKPLAQSIDGLRDIEGARKVDGLEDGD